MFEFDNICKEYENKSFEELKAVIRKDMDVILPGLETLGKDAYDTYLMLVMTACASSGLMGLEEYLLFQETTGITLTYQEVKELMKSASHKGAQEIVDYMVDEYGNVNPELKIHIVSMCLAYCAANGNISSTEKKFIKKLID